MPPGAPSGSSSFLKPCFGPSRHHVWSVPGRARLWPLGPGPGGGGRGAGAEGVPRSFPENPGAGSQARPCGLFRVRRGMLREALALHRGLGLRSFERPSLRAVRWAETAPKAGDVAGRAERMAASLLRGRADRCAWRACSAPGPCKPRLGSLCVSHVLSAHGLAAGHVRRPRWPTCCPAVSTLEQCGSGAS